jgi:hypothetical protein
MVSGDTGAAEPGLTVVAVTGGDASASISKANGAELPDYLSQWPPTEWCSLDELEETVFCTQAGEDGSFLMYVILNPGQKFLLLVMDALGNLSEAVELSAPIPPPPPPLPMCGDFEVNGDEECDPTADIALEDQCPKKEDMELIECTEDCVCNYVELECGNGELDEDEECDLSADADMENWNCEAPVDTILDGCNADCTCDYKPVPCYGMDGSMIDLKIMGGVGVALIEGTDEEYAKLLIGDEEHDLEICNVTDLAIVPIVGGYRLIILSEENKMVMLASWNGEELFMGQTFILNSAPLGVSYVGNPNRVAIAIEIADEAPIGFAFGRFSLTGALDKLTSTVAYPEGFVRERTIMHAAGAFNDNGYLVALNLGDQLVSFLETSNFNEVTIDASLRLLATDNVADMKLMFYDQKVALVISDDVNVEVRLIQLLRGDGTPLLITQPIAGIRSDGLKLAAMEDHVVIATPEGIPGRFDIGYTNAMPVLYILAGPDLLWTLADPMATTPAVSSVDSMEGIENALLIAVDSELEKILIGDDGTKTIVDMSLL